MLISIDQIKRVAVRKRKKYKITSPNKEVMVINNLKFFCQEHGLNHSTMRGVAAGRVKQHRGWLCEELEEEESE